MCDIIILTQFRLKSSSERRRKFVSLLCASRASFGSMNSSTNRTTITTTANEYENGLNSLMMAPKQPLALCRRAQLDLIQSYLSQARELLEETQTHTYSEFELSFGSIQLKARANGAHISPAKSLDGGFSCARLDVASSRIDYWLESSQWICRSRKAYSLPERALLLQR